MLRGYSCLAHPNRRILVHQVVFLAVMLAVLFGTAGLASAGITWTQMSNIGTDMWGVSYGGGKFVAAGTMNYTIGVLPDTGGPWSWTGLPSVNYPYGVAYNGTRWVAVADQQVAFSKDDTASNWVAHDSKTAVTLQNVIWADNKFVAVGTFDSAWNAATVIVTSADGLTWDTPQSLGSDGAWGIAWTGSNFVVVCYNGNIYTSPHATGTWTPANFDMAPTGPFYQVAYGGNHTLVAVGDSGQIYRSTNDGADWIHQTSGTSNTLFGVAYANGKFVAVGDLRTVISSTNGADWGPDNSGIGAGSEKLLAIAASPTKFMVVGEAGLIYSGAAASNNANLSNLTIDPGTLKSTFASGTETYDATVPNGTTCLTVTATKADSTATVQISSSATGSCSSGVPISTTAPTTVTVAVTAQDGSTKNYKINVWAAPSFTGAGTNTSQVVTVGDGLTPLAATNASGLTLTFSLTEATFLPSGITLSGDGTFVGTTDRVGNTTATIKVVDKYGGEAITTLDVTVNKIGTTTTLAASPHPSTFGDSVTLTATITSPRGTPSGSVTFSDHFNGTDTALGTAPLGSGTATLNTTALAGGSHSITATYSGDSSFNGSASSAYTQDVQAATGSLTVDSAGGDFGSSVTLQATLSPHAAGKTVTFTVDGSGVGTGSTNGSGVATFSYTISKPVGTYNGIVGASFAGDTDITAASVPNGSLGTLTVTQATGTLTVDPIGSTYRDAATLRATLSPAEADQTITFTVGGASVGNAKTGADGAATISYLVTDGVGTNPTIGASFAGNADIKAASGSNTLTVTKATGHISVQNVSGNPESTIALQATLLPAQAGLTVNFNVGGTGAGSGTTDATGFATVSYTLGKPAGDLTITAAFADNGNISGVSGTGTATINNLPPVVASITDQSTKEGSDVTLAASASDPNGDAITYGLSGAPAGLTINTSTGLISGTLTGTAGGNTYSVTVSATDPTGHTGSRTFTWTVTDDTAAPTWPSGAALAASAVTQTGLTLTWPAAADDVTVSGYRIYQDGAPVGSTTTATTYNVTGLTKNSTYSFKVEAIDPAGNETADGPTTSGTTALGVPDVTVTPDTGTLNAGGTLTFSFPGQPGVAATYNLTYQQSTDGTTYTAATPLAGNLASDLATPRSYSGSITITQGEGYWKQLHLTVTATDHNHGDAVTTADTDVATLVDARAHTTTFLAADHNPSVFGQQVTYTATISAVAPGTGTPTGTVTFYNGADSLGTGNLTSGVATFSTSALAVGSSHTITAIYNADSNFLTSTSSNTIGQEVDKAATSTAVTPDSPSAAIFGQPVTFTATVTVTDPGHGTPGGTITFYADGTALGSAVSLVGGTASLTTNALAVGDHTIRAVYSGDGNFITSDSDQTATNAAKTVTKAGTGTDLGTNHPSAVFGQSVTLTATVSVTAPGSGAPGGSVTFYDNNTDPATPLGSGNVVSGHATLDIASLSVGLYSITATYNGDGNFTGSTSVSRNQTINQADTTTSLASDANPAVFGQPVTFTATVAATLPGSGTPNGGTVTFYDNGAELGTRDVSGGHAAFQTAFTVGTHPITATYSGDSSFNGSSTSGSLGQVVGKADVTTTVSAAPGSPVYGQPVTLSVTVGPASPATGTPGGNVTFYDGATMIGSGAVALVNGAASISTATLAVGPHTIKVDYAGDGSFNPRTNAGSTSRTVGQAATTTTLGAAPSPSSFSQLVTFTATVTATAPGQGTPTGTVSFYNGATLLGASALDSSTGQDVAIITTSALRGGTPTITAQYGGDTNFIGSTSDPLTQTVNPATGSLTAGDVTGTFGATVTLQATLTPVIAGKTVSFTVDGHAAGTGTTDGSGVATASYPIGDDAGDHSIAAAFAGDADIASVDAAHSTPGTLKVTQATGTLVAASVSGTYRSTVTLQATLSPAAPDRSVDFTVNGTGVGSGTTDASGVATFSYLITTPVGTPAIGATFAGDAEIASVDAAHSTPGTLNVTQATGSLTAQSVQGDPGDTVTLRATLLPAETGLTVTFTVNGVNAGTGATDATGLATLTYTLGTHAEQLPLTTAFAGNGNISGATGSAAKVTIIDVPPTVDAIANQTNLEGRPVSLAVTGSDQNGDNLTFAATGLPPGLSIDMATGAISGALSGTAAGGSPYHVTVTATDDTPSGSGGYYTANDTGSRSFTWTVTDDTAAPTWPTGATLTVSTITETGLTLSWPAATDNAAVAGYRIYQDDTLIGTTTTATTFNVTGLTKNTSYSFKVEATDPAGNASAGLTAGSTTALGTPEVTPTARGAWLKAGDTIKLSFPGQAGVTASYSLAYQQSPDGSAYTAHTPMTGTFASDGASPPAYSATVTVPAGTGHWRNLVATVTATDPTSATTTATVTLTYQVDTVAPAISAAATDATRPLKSGEQFTVSATSEAGITAQATLTTLDPATGLPQPATAVPHAMTEATAGHYTYAYTVGASENRSVQVTVTLTDPAGNATTTTVAQPVVLDNTPPAISQFRLVAPSRLHGGTAYYGLGDTLTVEVSTEAGLTQGAPGLQDVTVTVPGATLAGLPGGVLHLTETGAGTGIYRGSYTVQTGDTTKTLANPTGRVNLQAAAADAAGNPSSTATADLPLIINTAGPWVTSVDHDGLAPVPIDGRVRITALAQPDLDTVTYSFGLNSGAVTRTGSLSEVAPGIYEATYTVSAADVTQLAGASVAITFTDYAGGAASRTITRPLIFDTTPPNIGTISVTPSGIIQTVGQLITVGFTSEPGLRAVATVNGLFTNLPFTGDGSGNYLLNYTVAAGDQIPATPVTVTAWDRAGNPSTAASSTTLTIVGAPPTVTVAVSDVPYGRDGWYTTAPTLTFRVQSGAALVLTDGATPVNIGSKITSGGLDRYSYTVPDGQHTYAYTASLAGSLPANGTLRPINVDTTRPTAPVVTANLPSGVTTTRQPTVDLTVTLAAGDGVTALDLVTNGHLQRQVRVQDSTVTIRGVPLAEDLNGGANPFVVRAYDQAGNASPFSAVVVITRDSTPPTFTIDVDQTARTITVTPSESLATGTLTVQAQVDGTALTVTPGSPAQVGNAYQYVWQGNVTGTTLRINVTGRDAAGNTGTGNWIAARVNPTTGGTVTSSDDTVAATFDPGTLTTGEVAIASYSVDEFRNNTFVPPGTQILGAYDFHATLNNGASVTVDYKLEITGSLPSQSQIGIYYLPVGHPDDVPTLAPGTMTTLSTRTATDSSGATVTIYTVRVQATLPHFSVWAPFVDQTAPELQSAVLVNGFLANGQAINTTTATITGTVDGTARTAQAIVDDNVVAGQDLGALTQADKSFSLPTPLGADGPKTITLKVLDEFGNYRTQDLSVVLDTQPPTVTDLKVNGTTYAVGTTRSINATSVRLTGSTEGGARLTVTGPDGSAVVSEALGSFDITVPDLTPNASSTFTVVATDAAGNSSQPSQIIIRSDTVKPTVTLTGLPPISSQTDATFSYSISEPVQSVALTVDGNADLSVTDTTDQSRSGITVHFPTDRSYTLTVTATDLAGNVDSATQQVAVNTTSPIVTVSVTPNPTSGSATLTATAIQGGTALTGDTPIVVRLRGQTLTLADPNMHDGSYTQTFAASDLNEGDNLVSVSLAGGGAISAEASILITKDTTAPAATGLAASPTVTNGDFTASFTLSEPARTVIEYRPADGSGSWNTGYTSGATYLAAGSHTQSIHLPAGNSYSLRLTATDALSNSSTTAFPDTVTIDTTPPVVTLTGLPASSNSRNRTFGYSVNEPVQSVTLSASGGATTGVTSAATQTGSGISLHFPDDGQYTVTVSAKDMAGNTSTTTQTIDVDSRLPVVTATLNPTLTGAGTTLTVSATVGNQPAPDDSTVTVVLHGQAVALTDPHLNGGSLTRTFAAGELAEGDNYAVVTVTRSNGLAATATGLVTKDTTPPDATGLSITPPATTSAVMVNFTLTERSQVLLEYAPGDGPWSTAYTSGNDYLPAGSQSQSVLLPTVGRYQFRLTMTDPLNHAQTRVFADAPSRVAPQPTPTIGVAAVPGLTAESTVALSGVASTGATVTVARNGETLATLTLDADGAFHYTATLVEGENQFTFTATARSLSAEATVSITRDSTAPALTATAQQTDATAASARLVIQTEQDARVTVNGQPVSLYADATALAPVTLQIGRNEFVVTATDQAGNTATITVVINRTAPQEPSGPKDEPDGPKDKPDGSKDEPSGPKVPATPTDIAGHWAEQAIAELVAKDAVQGFPDGTFEPDAPVTRAQFMTMLAKALGITPASGANLTFTDQETIPDWARGQVTALVAAGLAQGDAEGTFRPHDQISRAELAQMIARVLAYRGIKTVEADQLDFADADMIPAWSVPAVRATVGSKLMTGFPDGTFQAKEPVTRAQAAVVIQRLLGLAGGK